MITTRPRWQFDEMQQVGADFADPAEIEAFESKLKQFRGPDADAEDRRILDRLEVGPDSTLLDVGAGLGIFAVAAAKRCAKVYAVDVSVAMLVRARERVDAAGLTNVKFRHGGFLTYEHDASPVDAIVSHVALHHLPDAWKLIGLTRLAGMLRPGGRLHLKDVVFSFNPAEYRKGIRGMVDRLAEQTDVEFSHRLERHIRDEFSTFDWIMEGMLRQAGFRIDEVEYRPAGPSHFWCTREAGP
jgi:cyclopropane fatty-acyl-phospholipid synthase-like methyltransferase